MPNRLAACLATLVAITALAGCDSVEMGPPMAAVEAVEPWPEMLAAVNRVRASAQTCGGTRYEPAAPLTWSGRLGAAAQAHTEDMVANRFFDHVGSDGSHPGDRVTRAGYMWRAVGENIAMQYEDVDGVVSAWVASAGHCRNLMDPRFAEMGAVRQGEHWTQLFALHR